MFGYLKSEPSLANYPSHMGALMIQTGFLRDVLSSRFLGLNTRAQVTRVLRD